MKDSTGFGAGLVADHGFQTGETDLATSQFEQYDIVSC